MGAVYADKIAEMKKTLKGKRAAFVEEYIKDQNGTAAAIRAGIPEAGASVQASRFLREPEVLKYRDLLIEAAAAAIGVNKESLIIKAERVYRKSMEEKFFDARGAVKALEIQAKLEALLTERQELDGGEINININTRKRTAEDGS